MELAVWLQNRALIFFFLKRRPEITALVGSLPRNLEFRLYTDILGDMSMENKNFKNMDQARYLNFEFQIVQTEDKATIGCYVLLT